MIPREGDSPPIYGELYVFPLLLHVLGWFELVELIVDLWVCIIYMKYCVVGFRFVKMTYPKKESHFLFFGLESYSRHGGVCFLGFCLQKERYCVGLLKVCLIAKGKYACGGIYFGCSLV